MPTAFSAGTPQVTHFHGSPLGKRLPSVLTRITCRPEYILAGWGDVGAPWYMTWARACLPSGRKSPDWKVSKTPLARHPVPKGLISNVQAPVSLLGAMGGSGSSMILMGSGDGGRGMKLCAAVWVAIDSKAEKTLIARASNIIAVFYRIGLQML